MLAEGEMKQSSVPEQRLYSDGDGRVRPAPKLTWRIHSKGPSHRLYPGTGGGDIDGLWRTHDMESLRVLSGEIIRHAVDGDASESTSSTTPTTPAGARQLDVPSCHTWHHRVLTSALLASHTPRSLYMRSHSSPSAMGNTTPAPGAPSSRVLIHVLC